MKKFTSLILSILIIAGTFSCLSFTTANATATDSQYNIVARANYLWNTIWTSQKDVYGWKYQSTFVKGKAYHLPYGQPVSTGAYIGYGVTVEDFLTATKDASSVFYTTKSTYNGDSTYYATDCSAYVSWCWGLPRLDTSGIPKYATYIGGANTTYIPQLQIGDALNSTSVGHVVLVTGLTYCDGELTSIQITEQTPPQLKRTHYTPQELAAKYSSNYSIYRYTGDVEQAPTAGSEEFGTNPNLPESNPPLGALESVTTGEGTITIKGWAYDPDDPSANLDILVCIGGDSTVADVERHTVTADKLREDIASAYTIDNYHGFEVTINTQRSDSQPLYVYACNVGSGYDMHIGYTAVTIPADTTAPVITNANITNITKTDYTVSCNVSDNSGTVTSVKFPTFLSTQTLEDAVWYEGNVENGVATAVIPLSGDGIYNTHIYAYDYNGNYSTKELSTEITIDITPPEITNASITNVTENSYTVSCRVMDEAGISSVKFPSFHSSKTIEDAVWYEATIKNGYATAVISIDDLGGLDGTYNTHIYAYDVNDNYSVKELSTEIRSDMSGPVVSDIKVSDMSITGYTITCNVSDVSGVSNVKFLVYHSSQTVFDALYYDATLENGVATATIPIEELGGDFGTYINRIYAYDSYGNSSITETTAEIFNDTTAPEVSDIKVSTGNKNSFSVTCNASDDYCVSSVKLLVIHSSQEIEEGVWYEGTVENGVVTFTVPLDENNPDGKYYAYIHAYDSYNNHSVYQTTAEVNFNLADANCDGTIDIQDVTAIQNHIADITTLDENALKNADVNSDGKVSVRDATTIQLYLAKKYIFN